MPKVFISYSWDSDEHRQAVEELAKELQSRGIEVLLDKWQRLGTNLAHFMNQGLKGSDRVLCICTEAYVQKANGGTGGVGYESTILTAELMANVTEDRIIPVVFTVPKGGVADALPTFLNTRIACVFDGRDREAVLGELAGDIHAGRQPQASAFSQVDVFNAKDVYELARKIILEDDRVSWRRRLGEVKRAYYASLIEWRDKFDGGPFNFNEETTEQAVRDGLDCAGPLLSFALAGVESGVDPYCDQVHLIEEIVDVPDWNGAGLVLFADFPMVIAFVFHFLHGGLAVSTRQLELSTKFARALVQLRRGTIAGEVWQHRSLLGLIDALGRSLSVGSEWLTKLIGDSPWVGHVFGTNADAKVAVRAYGYVLNIIDLTYHIGRGVTAETIAQHQVRTPLQFLVGDIQNDDGYRLFLRLGDAICDIWREQMIDDRQISKAWKPWVESNAKLLGRYAWFSSGEDASNYDLMVRLKID